MSTAANAFFFYIRLPRRRSLYSSGRARGHYQNYRPVLYFILPPYHWVCVFMIIIAIKITNVILLLSLDSFPVVNPRRDDSVGKIDKIILLTTCLLVIIIIICTYSRHTLA